jgi:AraC-like DNA-binding protein
MQDATIPTDPSRWEVSLTELGHLKSEFIWAYESAVTSPIHSKRYQAPGQSAFLISAGRLHVETNAGHLAVGPGHWCLPHQGPRVLRMEPGGHLLSVRFRVYWPGGEPLFNAPVAEVIEASQAPKLEKQARTLIRAVSRAHPGAKGDLPWLKTDLLTYFRLQQTFDTWVSAYVETMLRIGAVASRLAKTDPRLLQVMSWIDGLPLDHLLTEDDLLRQSRLSSSQLNRLFTQRFALTPTQYFDNRKLTEAKRLIRSSPMAIKQVAYGLGFASSPAFTRWFRKKTGQSPREFQKGEQV